MPEKTNASPAGPLVGIKVLDFGTFVAGSYNALLMGDLGADVIKVEPLAGDPTRYLGPFAAGESRAFVGWNRNKRGLAIDLRTDAGIEIIHHLVRRTDVVTENFRPAIPKKLRLDYETLSAINPRLIYLAASGFGPKGPLRDRPSFDAVLQVMGGVAMANGVIAGKPVLTAPIVVDKHTALLGLSVILAALYHREKTGEGQKVETSLLQGVMSMMSASFYQPLEAVEAGAGGASPYGIFPTKDGAIFIAAMIDKHFEILSGLLEQPDLPSDPRFKSNVDRVTHKAELNEIIEALTRHKTSAELEEILDGHGVPCGILSSPAEFFDHPQVKAMDMDPVIHHSTIGPTRVYGVPFNLEKTPGRIQRSAPTLGEHNEEILRELDYDDQRIADLRENGVIPGA